MKKFKKKYDFVFLWWHFKGTVSTHKFGWKKKVKNAEVTQEKLPI